MLQHLQGQSLQPPQSVPETWGCNWVKGYARKKPKRKKSTFPQVPCVPSQGDNTHLLPMKSTRVFTKTPKMLPYRIHFPPLHPEVSHLNVRSSHRSQINRNSFCNFYCLDQLSGVSSGSRRKTNRQQGMPQLTGRWNLSVMKIQPPHKPRHTQRSGGTWGRKTCCISWQSWKTIMQILLNTVQVFPAHSG